MRSEQEVEEAISQIRSHDRTGAPILVDALQWALGRRETLNNPTYQVETQLLAHGEVDTEINLREDDHLELENTPYAIKIQSIDLIETPDFDWSDMLPDDHH